VGSGEQQADVAWRQSNRGSAMSRAKPISE
jgi:hypothetical protein